MPLIDLPGGLWLPTLPGWQPAPPTLVEIAQISGTATMYLVVTFRAPKAGTISEVGWFTTNVSGTWSLNAALQDGSPAGGATIGTVVTVGTPAAGTWARATGLNGTVTRGQLVKFVLYFGSYTSGQHNFGTWRSMKAGNTYLAGSLPTLLTVSNTGVAAEQDAVPVLAVKYNDGTYLPLGPLSSLAAFTGQGAVALDSSASSGYDEMGMVFTVPVRMRLGGFWAQLYLNATSYFDCTLYQGTSTVLVRDSVQVAGTADGLPSPRASTGWRFYFHPFSTPVDLPPDTYRLTVKPRTSAQVQVPYLTYLEPAAIATYDQGLGFRSALRAGGGGWTDASDSHPIMGLHVTGIDNGADTGTGSRFNRGFN